MMLDKTGDCKRNAGGTSDFECEKGSNLTFGCILKRKKVIHTCMNEHILYCLFRDNIIVY